MKQKPQTNLDPLKIFIQADNFILAHHVLLMQRDDWLRATANAGMVLSAFASELYMKTFICLETNDVPPWHDLSELFALISLSNRSRVEKYWNQQIIKNEKRLQTAERETGRKFPRDLSESLSVGGNTFKKLRYAYEDESRNNTYALDDLPACLREALLEVKPDWRHISKHFE